MSWKNKRLESIAILVVSLAIVTFVGVQVVGAIQDDIDEDTYDDYAQWCDNHDGDLVQSNVIGQHGGLHCQLENGTLIHFHNMNITNSETQ